jgi:hypothetical protein
MLMNDSCLFYVLGDSKEAINIIYLDYVLGVVI